MLTLSYSPITGAVYSFEPIREKVRLHSRNAKINRKAAQDLTVAAMNAGLSLKAFGEALGKVKIKP